MTTPASFTRNQVVTFQRTLGSRVYTYAALRVGNLWYVTDGEVYDWKRILRDADPDTVRVVDMATLRSLDHESSCGVDRPSSMELLLIKRLERLESRVTTLENRGEIP